MLAGVSEAPAEDGRASGKGRPTPKRSDARKQRRANTPKTRKEAAALRRERLKEQRAAQRQALVSGDERFLPPRDAGPAKRLARDIVDSRFTLGQVFFGLILLVLFVGFIPNRLAAGAANVVMLMLLGVLFFDAIRTGRAARRAVETKYGVKEGTGITAYALMRALQPRRMRRPPPKVQRGASV